jgi:hypothetical protein
MKHLVSVIIVSKYSIEQHVRLLDFSIEIMNNCNQSNKISINVVNNFYIKYIIYWGLFYE